MVGEQRVQARMDLGCDIVCQVWPELCKNCKQTHCIMEEVSNTRQASLPFDNCSQYNHALWKLSAQHTEIVTWRLTQIYPLHLLGICTADMPFQQEQQGKYMGSDISHASILSAAPMCLEHAIGHVPSSLDSQLHSILCASSIKGTITAYNSAPGKVTHEGRAALPKTRRRASVSIPCTAYVSRFSV